MSFTGEFKAGMWINADLSDEMNPKFEYIFSSPASSKYMKLDLIESIRNSGGSAANFASEFKKLIAKSRSDEMQSKLVDILRNNSTITSVKGSKAVIRLSDKQMQNYIGEVLEYMSQQLNDNSGFEELASGEYGIGDFSVILPYIQLNMPADINSSLYPVIILFETSVGFVVAFSCGFP